MGKAIRFRGPVGQSQNTTPADAAGRRRRPKHIPMGVPRRLLSREEAAIYVGVSTTLFDEMVADGRMPKPLRINSRVLWDIRKLDAAVDTLDTSEQDDDAWGDMRA